MENVSLIGPGGSSMWNIKTDSHRLVKAHFHTVFRKTVSFMKTNHILKGTNRATNTWLTTSVMFEAKGFTRMHYII